MGFDDVNRSIATSGGSWVKMNKKGEKVAGKLTDIIEREQKDMNKEVKYSKSGNVRKEWVLTLETTEGVKKVSLKENGQFALRGALAAADETLIKPNAYIELEVTKGSSQNPPSAAELKATYTAPGFNPSPSDNDNPFAEEEAPF